MWNLLKSTYCYQSNHIFLNKRKLVNELKNSQMALNWCNSLTYHTNGVNEFVFPKLPFKGKPPKNGGRWIVLAKELVHSVA